MANDIMRYLQRGYFQIQSAFDVIPNTGGAATVAGSDCCLIKEWSTDAAQAEIPRTDKTGTLDQIIAQGGRKSATASATMTMAGNGTPGVAPDCKNPLQAAFGKAPTINAGTSVVFSLDDLLYYLTGWNFNAPNTATQMAAFNALVTRLECTFGGDEPTLAFTLEPGWVYDSDQAADAQTDALAKGGLTAFPNEPGTPIVSGTFPPGWDVVATLDGTAYDTLLTGKIVLEIARELRKNTNKMYPRPGAAGLRKVSCDFSITDDDSAPLRALKQKAMRRVPVNLDFAIGHVAGNIWDWALNNVVMPKPKYGDEGPRRKIDWNGCVAYPSAIGAKDQLVLTIR